MIAAEVGHWGLGEVYSMVIEHALRGTEAAEAGPDVRCLSGRIGEFSQV